MSQYMNDLVLNFPNQLQEAIEIGEKFSVKAPQKTIQNVVISGLGGSGIGGTIVSQLLANDLNVPVTVVKTYNLPAFVNENTLFIASSYSGNTEETLATFAEAESKGAQIACVTSGGTVLQKAQENNYPHIIIPGGLPPRAAFGYSVAQLFFVLKAFGLTSAQPAEQLKAVPNFLDEHGSSIVKYAHELTAFLFGKLPVLYTSTWFEGVAIRFRQQINENSKMLCWHHVFPEMNHNELVGWRKQEDELAVVLFKTDFDHIRTAKRMEISEEVFHTYTKNIATVQAKGANMIEQAFYLIHLGDWISVLLADKKGIDSVEVDVITRLKNELASFKS